MKKYNVTALGEILIDFAFVGYSDSGMGLFEQNPGGAPANVLAAVSALGGKAAFIGKVGKDMHGTFLKNVLCKQNIESKCLYETDEAFTTLAFVDISPTGERSFSFARNPGADTLLSKDELDYSLIEDSFFFHMGSLSLTHEPAKSASFAALDYAKEKGIPVSYDPNYRASLWKSEEQAIKEMRSVIPYADFMKFSDEEARLLTDEQDPEKAIKVILEQSVSCVALTMGAKGAYIGTKDFVVFSPAYACKAVDTTGAGDSFVGAFLYMLSKNNMYPWELTREKAEEFAAFANKVASLCVGKRGGISSMPTMDEVMQTKSSE